MVYVDLDSGTIIDPMWLVDLGEIDEDLSEHEILDLAENKLNWK